MFFVQKNIGKEDGCPRLAPKQIREHLFRMGRTCWIRQGASKSTLICKRLQLSCDHLLLLYIRGDIPWGDVDEVEDMENEDGAEDT